MLTPHIREDVWPNESAARALLESFGHRTGKLELRFAPADCDVPTDLVGRLGVDNRADVRAGLHRVAHNERPRRFDKAMQERVVRGLYDDRPAARRALLPRESEGGLTNAEHGFVQVGRRVDNDGVLPAHLADHALHV